MNLIINDKSTKKEIKAGDILVVSTNIYGDKIYNVLVFKSDGNFILVGLDGVTSWGIYGVGSFDSSEDIRKSFTIIKHFSSEEYGLKAKKKNE